MEQYHWILSKDEIVQLKTGIASHKIWHEEKMKYGDDIEFIIGLSREANTGATEAGIGLRIKSLPTETCSGRYSIMVEAIDYTKNDNAFFNVPEDGYRGIYAFKSSSLSAMDTLTLHFAIAFR